MFLQNKKLAEAGVYEPSLTRFGRDAVERFFMPQEPANCWNWPWRWRRDRFPISASGSTR
jgi:hypothetical protein